MEIPKIEFDSWFRWRERGSIENSEKHGVYMLSRSTTALHAPDPLDENVIYFGETCNQSLKRRWTQFDLSAFHGIRGHSGGSTYRERFKDDGLELYVAAMPVLITDEQLRSSFIRFAERKLILEYVVKWNRLPACNQK